MIISRRRIAREKIPHIVGDWYERAIKHGVSHASPESAAHVSEHGIRVSLREGENINSAYNFYAKQASRRRRRRRRLLLVNTSVPLSRGALHFRFNCAA